MRSILPAGTAVHQCPFQLNLSIFEVLSAAVSAVSEGGRLKLS